MGNYAPPRFSTVGTQERLASLGFEDVGLENPAPAVDAWRRIQPNTSLRPTVLFNYINKKEKIAASIILDHEILGGHAVKIITLPLSDIETDKRDYGAVIPYIVTDYDFMQGARLTSQLATDPKAIRQNTQKLAHYLSHESEAADSIRTLADNSKIDGAQPGEIPFMWTKIAPRLQPN
jgi:hypothetical protein